MRENKRTGYNSCPAWRNLFKKLPHALVDTGRPKLIRWASRLEIQERVINFSLDSKIHRTGWQDRDSGRIAMLEC